jgi:hypothetical protein
MFRLNGTLGYIEPLIFHRRRRMLENTMQIVPSLSPKNMYPTCRVQIKRTARTALLNPKFKVGISERHKVYRPQRHHKTLLVAILQFQIERVFLSFMWANLSQRMV